MHRAPKTTLENILPFRAFHEARLAGDCPHCGVQTAGMLPREFSAMRCHLHPQIWTFGTPTFSTYSPHYTKVCWGMLLAARSDISSSAHRFMADVRWFHQSDPPSRLVGSKKGGASPVMKMDKIIPWTSSISPINHSEIMLICTTLAFTNWGTTL